MKKGDVLQKVRNAELTNAVLRQIGGRFWEIWENLDNYRNAENGVPGFIYYEDTERFAKKNIAKIVLALREFEEEIGEPLKKDENILNWYAWFALEHVIDELMMIKEEEIRFT